METLSIAMGVPLLTCISTVNMFTMDRRVQLPMQILFSVLTCRLMHVELFCLPHHTGLEERADIDSILLLSILLLGELYVENKEFSNTK